MSDSNVITVGNVSKIFTLRGEETALTRLIKWREHLKLPRKFTALNNVSFEVSDGEVLGIVGRNGSGKSTLLRILAGIYPQTSGDVKIRGRVVPLINLQVGMQPKLTMKDNIYLISSLFGISWKKTRDNFESIVDFSELKDFVNAQVYQFSSGMLSRLAFSIAIHLEPEVMLLDEVFYAGDAGFREKSRKKMTELIKGDCTVVIVSHQEDIILRLCDRVLWLENGCVQMLGEPEDVLSEYNEHRNKRIGTGNARRLEPANRVQQKINNFIDNPKVLVVGMAKSGTTALFYQIKNSMPDSTLCLFERKNIKLLPKDEFRPVLAKEIIGKAKEDVYAIFDKRILIIRDPRDMLISTCLYMVRHEPFVNDEKFMREYIGLLRKKEKDPRCVSIRQILSCIDDKRRHQKGKKVAWLERIPILQNKHNLFLIKYEDFVRGDIINLEKYLGFKLVGLPQVEPARQRVERTKWYGDWKNWFTEEDVIFFQPRYKKFLQLYGYEDDWSLNPNPVISSEHASLYVERIVNEVRGERVVHA